MRLQKYTFFNTINRNDKIFFTERFFTINCCFFVWAFRRVGGDASQRRKITIIAKNLRLSKRR